MSKPLREAWETEIDYQDRVREMTERANSEVHIFPACSVFGERGPHVFREVMGSRVLRVVIDHRWVEESRKELRSRVLRCGRPSRRRR